MSIVGRVTVSKLGATSEAGAIDIQLKSRHQLQGPRRGKKSVTYLNHSELNEDR
jgi:hypothetical protein